MKNRIRRYLLYGGIPREDYDQIRAMLWSRNLSALRVTASLSVALGLVFLGVIYARRSGVWFPYLFLLCGSALVLLLIRVVKEARGEIWRVLLCYAQMAVVCGYAGILSTQPSNYGIPATSVIVFIALLPLGIDDRPVRMFLVMLCETVGYLVVSSLTKAPQAFSLDVMNAATFCLVGMVVYGIICARNIRELHQSVRVERIQRSVISSLASVVEERDESTGGHIQRTEQYVELLTGCMREHEAYSGLPREFFNNVVLAAPMHDIGKIRIPDRILNKPGKLTTEEFEIMKTHTVFGGDIIRKTMSDVEEKDYCDIAFNIARYHHERYDGTGYPDGLRGEEIPLEARVMALADVYDALISERVYKRAFSVEEAVAIIEGEAGKQFDPVLTPIFLQMIRSGKTA